MKHLGWFNFGEKPQVPTTPVIFMVTPEGELEVEVRDPPARVVRTMCNLDVPAKEIVSDLLTCDCERCRMIHVVDLNLL